MNYSIYTNTNTRYRWRLIMPTGFSVSGGGNPTYNGAPATYTQVGDTITILSPDSILGQASIDLIFTCGIGGPKTFYYTMEKINDITTSCECQSDLVCDSVEVFAISNTGNSTFDIAVLNHQIAFIRYLTRKVFFQHKVH